ncbi:SagB/ThcOx family dehydrogenase [Treponema sp.]
MSDNYRKGRNFLKANWYLVEGDWKSDQSIGVAAPDQEEKPAPDDIVIPLVSADDLIFQGQGLLELLRARKSRRKYVDKYFTDKELSFLCWSVAGIKEHRRKFSFRTYPSGGARHPLDLFIYITRVEGFEEGIYRYLPIEHAVVRIRMGNQRQVLDAALLEQYWDASIVFIWVAVPYRTEWRYGPVSHKIIALDVGHACENLYLACESIGAGTCAIGAYDQEKMDSFLGLDGEDRFAMYAAPVGKVKRS